VPYPPRIQVPDVPYHVTSRAVDRQPIFGIFQGDRAGFMTQLGRVVERYGWNLYAYCLMGNHFHLVLETPGANIAGGMQSLKSGYALWFNAWRTRSGHLFERRYFSRLAETHDDVCTMCRYVVLNPVRAGLCAHPADWPWSSYRATADIGPVPPFLDVDRVRELFGGVESYREAIASALDGPGVSL